MAMKKLRRYFMDQYLHMIYTNDPQAWAESHGSGDDDGSNFFSRLPHGTRLPFTVTKTKNQKKKKKKKKKFHLEIEDVDGVI